VGYAVAQIPLRQDRTPGGTELLLCDGRRVLFCVLKNRSGKLTQEQSIWISMLRHTGYVEVHVWRPQDWQAIVATLRQAPASGIEAE
jgi:hypothetical protein